MSNASASRKRLLLLVFTGCVCLLLFALMANWNLHARLNILVGGHVVYHLADPTNGFTDAVASKFVFKAGTYVGYLDGNGNFVNNSESIDGAMNRNYYVTAVLRILLATYLLFLSGILLFTILRVLKRNK